MRSNEEFQSEIESDAERVVLGLAPPAVVCSDGKAVWVDSVADPDTTHPSILQPSAAAGVVKQQHALEFWLWDLCGYLILHGEMDEDWVQLSLVWHNQKPELLRCCLNY